MGAVREMKSFGLILGGIVLCLCSAPAIGRPLDADTCEKLKKQSAVLIRLGAEKNLLKGPDWASDNLDSVGMDRVRLYIEIQEDILFRCPEPKKEKKAKKVKKSTTKAQIRKKKAVKPKKARAKPKSAKKKK